MLNHAGEGGNKFVLRETGLARTCLPLNSQSMAILCAVCQTVCSKDVPILVTFPVFRFYASTAVNQFPRNFSIIFRVILDLSVQ